MIEGKIEVVALIEVTLIEERNNTGLLIDGRLISVFQNQNANDVLNWVHANISNVKVSTKGGVIHAQKKHEIAFR